MSLRLLPLLALVVAALGCGAKPPLPAPAPVNTVAEAPKPPPPPKCEAVEEKCQADSTTRAKIAKSDYKFSPGIGWVYAQGSGATVAQSSDTGPAMVFEQYDGDAKDQKKETTARDAAYADVTKAVAITPPKPGPNWRTPYCQCTSGKCQGAGGEQCKQMKPGSDLKASVWQVDGSIRKGRKGSMLVVVAPVADGAKSVIGIGFLPDDDNSGAETSIMKSIETLGPSSAPQGGK